MSTNLVTTKSPARLPLTPSLNLIDSLNRDRLETSQTDILSLDSEDVYLQHLRSGLNSSFVSKISKVPLIEDQLQHLIENLVNKVSFVVRISKNDKLNIFKSFQNSIQRLSSSELADDKSEVKSLKKFLKSSFFHKTSGQFDDTVLDCSFYPFRLYHTLLSLLKSPPNSCVLKIVGGFVRETVEKSISPNCKIHAMDIDIKVDAKQLISDSETTSQFYKSFECIENLSDEFLKYLVPDSSLYANEHKNLIVNIITRHILKNVKPICYQNDQLINVSLGDASARTHDITILAKTSVESICNLDSARIVIDPLIRLLNQAIAAGQESGFEIGAFIKKLSHKDRVFVEGTTFFSHQEFIDGWLAKSLKLSNDYKHFNESAFIKLMDFVSKGWSIEETQLLEKIVKKLQPHLIIKSLNNHLKKHVSNKDGFIVLLNTLITLNHYFESKDITQIYVEFFKTSTFTDELPNSLSDSPILLCFFKALKEKIPFSTIISHFELIQAISLYSTDKSIVKSQVSAHLGLSIQIKTPFSLFIPVKTLKACKIITLNQDELNQKMLDLLKELVFSGLNPLNIEKNPKKIVAHESIESLPEIQTELIDQLLNSKIFINQMQGYYHAVLNYAKHQDVKDPTLLLNKSFFSSEELPENKLIEILNTLKNLLDDEILFSFLKELYVISDFPKKSALYLFILNSQSSFCNQEFLAHHFISRLYDESKNLNLDLAESVFKRLGIEEDYAIFKTLNKTKASIKWCAILANHLELSKMQVCYEIFKSLYSFFKVSRHEAQSFLLSLNPLQACKFFNYLQKQKFYLNFQNEAVSLLKHITSKNYDFFLSRVEKCFDVFLENFSLDKNSYDASEIILKIASYKCELKTPPLIILKNLLIQSYDKKLLKMSSNIENLSISLVENLFQTHPISCLNLLHTSYFKSFNTPLAITRRTNLLEKMSKAILNLDETEQSNLKEIFSKYSLTDKTFYHLFLGNVKTLNIVIKQFHEKKTVSDALILQFIEDFFSTNPDITSFEDEDVLFLGSALNDLISNTPPEKDLKSSKKSPPLVAKNGVTQQQKAGFIPELFIRRLSEKNVKCAATLLSNSYKNKLVRLYDVEAIFNEVLSKLENNKAEDIQFLTDFWTSHQNIFKVNVSDKNNIFFTYLKLHKTAKHRLNLLKQYSALFKHKDYFEECFTIFKEEFEKDILGTFVLLEVFLSSSKNKLLNGHLFLLLNSLQLNEDLALVAYKYITKQVFYDSLSQNNYLTLALKILKLCVSKIDCSHLVLKMLNETFLREMSKADLKTFIQLLGQYNDTAKNKENVLSQVALHTNLIVSRAEKLDNKADLMSVILHLLSSAKNNNLKNYLLSISTLNILISYVKNLDQLELIYIHLEKHPNNETPIQQIQLIANFFNHNLSGLSKFHCRLIKKIMDAYQLVDSPCSHTLKNTQKSFEKTLQCSELTVKEQTEILTYLLPYPDLINDTIADRAVKIIAKQMQNKNIQAIESIVPMFACSILKDSQNKDLKKFIDYLIDSHDPYKISSVTDLLLKNQLLNAYFFNKIVLFLKNYKPDFSLDIHSSLIFSFESLFNTAFELDLHKKNFDQFASDLNQLFIFLIKCETTFCTDTFHLLPEALSAVIKHSNDIKLSTDLIGNLLKILNLGSSENAISLINVVEKVLMDLDSAADEKSYELAKEKLYLAFVTLSLKIDDTYISLCGELIKATAFYQLSAKIKNFNEPLLLKKLLEKSVTYLKNFYIGHVNIYNQKDKHRLNLKKQQETLIENLSKLLPAFFNICSYSSDVYNKFSFILTLSQSQIPALIATSGFFLNQYCDDFDENENTDLNEENFKDVFVKLIKEQNFCNDVIDVSKILKHKNISKVVSKRTLAFLYKEWLKNEYLFFDNFDLNLYKDHISFLMHDQNSNIEMAQMVVKNQVLNLYCKANENENAIDVCSQFCQDFIRLLNTTQNLDVADISRQSLETFLNALFKKIDSVATIDSDLFFKNVNFKTDHSSIHLLSKMLKALLVAAEEVQKFEPISIFILNFIEMFVLKLSSITFDKTNQTADLSDFRNLSIDFIFSSLWYNPALKNYHIERKNALTKKVEPYFVNHMDDITMLEVFISKNFQSLNYKKNSLSIIKKIIAKSLSYPQIPQMLVLGIDLLVVNINDTTYQDLKPLIDIIPSIAFYEISMCRKMPAYGQEYIFKVEQQCTYEHLINLTFNQTHLKSHLRSVFLKDVYTGLIQTVFSSTDKFHLISFEQKTKLYIFLIQSLTNFIKSELTSAVEARTILKHVKINLSKNDFWNLADDAILKNYFEIIDQFNTVFKNTYNLIIKCSNESDVENSLLQHYVLSPFFIVLNSYHSVLSAPIQNECKKVFLSWMNTLIDINTLKSLDKAKADLNSFECFVDDKFDLFKKITQKEVALFRKNSILAGLPLAEI